jgi:hypothetical protein
VVAVETTRGYRALGFEFRFESDDAELLLLFDYAYRDLAPADGPVHVLRALVNGDGFRVTIAAPGGPTEVCEELVQPSATFEVLTWEVNHRATLTRAQHCVVHATATGADEAAVVLCGPSYSGKSTLAAAAAQRGWAHLSDDLAPIDPAMLTVEPYQRPIMVRDHAAQGLGLSAPRPEGHHRFVAQESFYPASLLGAAWVSGPVGLRAVVSLSWGQTTALTAVSRARTLYTLAHNCTTLAQRGGAGFADLEAVASAVPGFHLDVASPDEAINALGELLATS